MNDIDAPNVEPFDTFTVGEIEYEVAWVSQDLVFITVDGDLVLEIASSSWNGFSNRADALNQAEDAVLEMTAYDQEEVSYDDGYDEF